MVCLIIIINNNNILASYMGLLQKRSTGTFLSFYLVLFLVFFLSFAYLVVGTFYKLSKMYRANYYCCSVAVCIFFCFFFFIFFGNLQVASRAKIINMTFVVHLLSLSFFFHYWNLNLWLSLVFHYFLLYKNRRKF